MDGPPRYPPLYPTRFGGVLYGGYRYPFTSSIQPSGSGALAGRRNDTIPRRPVSPPGRADNTPKDTRPWPRDGSPEFVTQLAVEDMFANSPEPHGLATPVSGPSAPVTRVSGPFAPQAFSSSSTIPEPARHSPSRARDSLLAALGPRAPVYGPPDWKFPAPAGPSAPTPAGPSAPIPFVPAPFAHDPAWASPPAPEAARSGASAQDSPIAGPSNSTPDQYGPFAFSPSDFLDENVPSMAPSPLPYAPTARWSPAREEPTTAVRLRSATDFREWNDRPMMDFDAPQKPPYRHRRRRVRGDERMADEDQDPEDGPAERVGRSMIRTQDGYDSESWRRHNNRLNRMRRAGNQNGQERSSANRKNESKETKESASDDSEEDTGNQEKRMKNMSLAEGKLPEAGGH